MVAMALQRRVAEIEVEMRVVLQGHVIGLVRRVVHEPAEYTERFANPYIAAERGYIDDVIEPGRTRGELIRALRIALRKERRRNPRWHGNIPL